MRIVIIIVVILVLLVGCCVGGGYFMWQYGMGQLTTMVQSQIEDSPVITEKIGTINEMSMAMMAMGEYQQETGRNDLIFDLTGSKGNGRLIVSQQADESGFDWAILEKDGERFGVMGNPPASLNATPAPDSGMMDDMRDAIDDAASDAADAIRDGADAVGDAAEDAADALEGAGSGR